MLSYSFKFTCFLNSHENLSLNVLNLFLCNCVHLNFGLKHIGLLSPQFPNHRIVTKAEKRGVFHCHDDYCNLECQMLMTLMKMKYKRSSNSSLRKLISEPQTGIEKTFPKYVASMKMFICLVFIRQ